MNKAVTRARCFETTPDLACKYQLEVMRLNEPAGLMRLEEVNYVT
jgi:hypothetical protein